LVIGWGSTHGAIYSAVDELQKQGMKISQTHFNYILPFPKNTAKIFKGFKKIVVCELNAGQLVNYLRMKFPQYQFMQYNKVQGLPFVVSELKDKFNQILKEK